MPSMMFYFAPSGLDFSVVLNSLIAAIGTKCIRTSLLFLLYRRPARRLAALNSSMTLMWRISLSFGFCVLFTVAMCCPEGLPIAALNNALLSQLSYTD